MRISLISIILLLTTLAQANITESVGKPDFSDWMGITKVENNTATVNNGETISFTYSNRNRIYFPNISRNYYGDAANYVPYSGLAFELYLQKDSTTEVTAALKVHERDYDECNPVSTAKIRIMGQGWHSVYIPWEMFDVDAGQKWGTLFGIQHVELTFNSKANSSYQLRDVHITKGQAVALEAAIQGKSSDAGTLDGSETLHCEIADVKAWSYFGHYFSKKLRAAVLLQRYLESEKKNTADKTKAVTLLKEAKADWANLVAVTKPHYHTIPVTALHRRLFSWDSRSATVDKDIILAEEM